MTITPDQAAAVTSGAAPAPNPTDNTSAQAQAPAQAPAQPTTTAAPASSPAQTPAQGTTPTPSTTQSGLPGVPTADASAVATAHPTSVLRGALMGILGAAAKVGKGVEAVGRATGAGQSIVRSLDEHKAAETANAGAIAKQGQEAQAAKDAQQKAQDEHIAAGDTHNEAPLRMNILSNQNTSLALMNSTTQENLSEAQQKNLDMVNAYHARLLQVLRDQNIPVQMEQGAGFDNLNKSHAADITANKVVALNNGQTGENHGLYFVDQQMANSTPLTKDVDIVADYKVNPKTGDMEEVHQTLRAGHDTVATLLNSTGVQMQKWTEKSQIANQIQKQNLNAADIKEKGAAANKSNAEAENQRAQAAQFGGQTLEHTASQLVEGNEDPSQLTKRSKNYDATLAAADDYSMKHYGVHFSPAQAGIDYKFAMNPSTQNTLKYLNSLTGADNRSGNLGELVDLSSKIKRTQFPALNDTAAWARLQVGDPQMAAYFAAVTEVSDQVAKIMQGGGSGSGTSDAKIKQAMELFDKGFNKDQISAISGELRNLLANRKKEMIGTNRYLVKQFPSVVAPNGTKFIADDANGVKHYLDANHNDLGIVGYGVK